MRNGADVYLLKADLKISITNFIYTPGGIAIVMPRMLPLDILTSRCTLQLATVVQTLHIKEAKNPPPGPYHMCLQTYHFHKKIVYFSYSPLLILFRSRFLQLQQTLSIRKVLYVNYVCQLKELTPASPKSSLWNKALPQWIKCIDSEFRKM